MGVNKQFLGGGSIETQDFLSAAHNPQHDNDGDCIGDPILHVGVAPDKRQTLDDLDQRAKYRQGDAKGEETSPWNTKKAEKTQNRKRKNMQDFI